METTSTFCSVISNIINDFETTYYTAKSLVGVIERLEDLPFNEKQKHEFYIVAIEKTIFSYGKGNEFLSTKQSTDLLGLLKGSLTYASEDQPMKLTSVENPPTNAVELSTSGLSEWQKSSVLRFKKAERNDQIIR